MYLHVFMGLDVKIFFLMNLLMQVADLIYSLHSDSKEMTQKHFFPLSGITVTEVASGLKNIHVILRKMKQDNI